MLKNFIKEMDALLEEESKKPKLNLFGDNQRIYYKHWKNSICSRCENCRVSHKKIDNQVIILIKCDGFNMFLSEHKNLALETQEGELLHTTIDSCFTCGTDK